MDAIKFMKLDLKMFKSQLMVYFLYPIFGIFMVFTLINDAKFVIGYMIFGFMIISITPFNVENAKSRNTFYHTLPTKAESMVLGRFLLLLIGAVGYIMFSILIILFSISKGGVFSDLHKLVYITIAMVAILICYIQYVIFYKIGVMKSQRFFTMVSMLPGFVFWIGSSYGIQYLDKSIDGLQNILSYAKMHMFQIAIFEIIILGVAFYISYKVSSIIYQKKEI